MTYADEKQALDRINRRGQRRNMRAFHITTAGTVDERIDAINARKRDEYERVVHGSAVFARWFEENEAENIRELLSGMISSQHSTKPQTVASI